MINDNNTTFVKINSIDIKKIMLIYNPEKNIMFLRYFEPKKTLKIVLLD